jgi:hypothetical protein
MSEHTPGPWVRQGASVFAPYHNGHYDKNGPEMCNRFSLHVEHRQGADSRTGDRFGCSQEEAEANARLIAAAPDLLMALEAAKEFADDEFSACNDLPRKNRISKLCDLIDAALSKAKEQSNGQ